VINQRKNMAYIVELRNVDIWKIWKEEGQMEIISRRGDMKFYQRNGAGRCGLGLWNRAQCRRKLKFGVGGGGQIPNQYFF
jgi:hypothetical protein